MVIKVGGGVGLKIGVVFYRLHLKYGRKDQISATYCTRPFERISSACGGGGAFLISMFVQKFLGFSGLTGTSSTRKNINPFH